MSTCPYCRSEFYRAKSKEQQTVCPKCLEPVFIIYRRKKKIVLTTTEYELHKKASSAAEALVKLLEVHISRRDQIEFTFSLSERVAQLAYAHPLVQRSIDYLNAKKDNLGLDPYEFIQEVALELLKDDYWQTINSWLMARNQIGIVAQQLFRQKKLALQQNEAIRATYVDYTAFMI